MRDGSALTDRSIAIPPKRRAGRIALGALTLCLTGGSLVIAQEASDDDDAQAETSPPRVEVHEFADRRAGAVRAAPSPFIEAPQVVARVDVSASQIEALRPEAAERMRYNTAAFQRLAERNRAAPAREVEVEQTPERPDGLARMIEEPRVDDRGRPLYTVDWEMVERDWGAQLEEMSAGDPMIVSQQRVRRAPLRLAPVVRNMPEAALSEVAVPVLAPGFTGARTRSHRSERAEDGMLMFSQGDSYTASLHMDAVLITVSGSRVANVVEEDEGRARLMREMAYAEDLIITPIRGGQEILFNRYGVAYSVLILCENPAEDVVCADPETARAVARSLMLVGGAPRMPEANR